MAEPSRIKTMRAELAAGIQLSKCQKCGCMQETLDELGLFLPTVHTQDAHALARDVAAWRAQMQPIRYTCLGCAYCYPAVAHNALTAAFPSSNQLSALQCDFQVNTAEWPPVVGEYAVLDKSASVAVSTLASIGLADEFAQRKPQGLAIIGKTETENIGIDKVIKNITTNPALRYLIVAGKEAKGHLSGSTLLALAAHGIDSTGRVIDSPSKRPILRNVSAAEVEAFRAQVQVIDMRGCESPQELSTAIEALPQHAAASCSCRAEVEHAAPQPLSRAPIVIATESSPVVRMDKAGYFVIIPRMDTGTIHVEHYAYDNTLLRIIEGTKARDICTTLITQGWVMELSHATYLGRELAKAELSLTFKFSYLQDGA